MFLDLWNEHRGPLPKALGPNTRRANGVKALVKEHGLAKALELFTHAVKQVASDPYWGEKGYNIDNLLRPGRVAEKAEKQLAGPGVPRAKNGAPAYVERPLSHWKSMTGAELLGLKP